MFKVEPGGIAMSEVEQGVGVTCMVRLCTVMASAVGQVGC